MNLKKAITVIASFAIGFSVMTVVYGERFEANHILKSNKQESGITLMAASPSPSVSPRPSGAPRPSGSVSPTIKPTSQPTATPTLKPTATPTPEPTATPTPEPTEIPTQKPIEESTPTPVPEPTEEPPVVYDDKVITAYAASDSYITAQYLGLNIPGTSIDMNTDSSIFKSILKSDPYVSNGTLKKVSGKDKVAALKPNIIFGNKSGYNYNDALYLQPPGNSIDGMLSKLEDYVESVDEYASTHSLKTRNKNLAKKVKNDIIDNADKQIYEPVYNAYYYYKTILMYANTELQLINHDKKKVVVFNPETKRAYGTSSDAKCAQYFKDICINIAGASDKASVSASDLNGVDIVATADFGDYSESEVRAVLSDMGVSRADEIKILSHYPDGISGMTNNSIESLAGFAYCAGFAYYDLLPDNKFNPVSMFGLFYNYILGVDANTVTSNIGTLIGDASLPDGVDKNRANLTEADSILYDGYKYILNPPAPAKPTPTPIPLPEDIYYGDVFRDGEVTIKDAVYLFQLLSSRTELSPVEKEAADVNEDGDVRMDDYVFLMHYINQTKVHYKGDEYYDDLQPMELPFFHPEDLPEQ